MPTDAPPSPPKPRVARRRTLRVSLGAFVVFVAYRVVSALVCFRGPPDGFVPPQLRAATHGLGDFKGVVHCHSHLSHDSIGSFDTIGEAARRVGLDFVIVTDHIASQTVERAAAEAAAQRQKNAAPLFIVGAELGSVQYGLLAFPLQREVTDRHSHPAKTIKAIHAQDAVAFVSHAEKYLPWPQTPMDGIEIYNLHADIRQANRFTLLARTLLLPPRQLLGSLVKAPRKNLDRWDALLLQRPLPVVGSADAHAQRWMHIVGGSVVGIYERAFKVVTTHVFAKQCDEASVVEALQRGRGYVAFDIWRDATGFAFTASHGGTEWMMGDEPNWSENLRLKIQLPVAADIRLIKDGSQIASHLGDAFTHKPDAAGAYRVEVFLNQKLWIISNPIYVR
jgi:hypothetical protein